MPLPRKRPDLYDPTVDERVELKAIRFLVIQLDDWQAVYTEGSGDLAAVMDVVLENPPNDRLERNRGPFYSIPARRI